MRPLITKQIQKDHEEDFHFDAKSYHVHIAPFRGINSHQRIISRQGTNGIPISSPFKCMAPWIEKATKYIAKHSKSFFIGDTEIGYQQGTSQWNLQQALKNPKDGKFEIKLV